MDIGQPCIKSQRPIPPADDSGYCFNELLPLRHRVDQVQATFPAHPFLLCVYSYHFRAIGLHRRPFPFLTRRAQFFSSPARSGLILSQLLLNMIGKKIRCLKRKFSTLPFPAQNRAFIGSFLSRFFIFF